MILKYKKLYFIIVFVVAAAIMADRSALPLNNGAPDKEVKGRKEVIAPDDYTSSKLPMVLYSMLMEDSAFLKGEKFKGSLIGGKIIGIPASLRSKTGKNDRLLLAYTRLNGSRVYIIIPREKISYFSKKIRKKEKIYFSFIPVGIYYQAPLVSFLDSYGDEESVKKVISGGIAEYYPVREGDQWSIIIGTNLKQIKYTITEVKGNTAKGTVRESIPGSPESEKPGELVVAFSADTVTVLESGTDAAGLQFKSSDVILKGPLKIGTRWTVSRDDQDKKREIIALNTSVVIGEKQYENVLVVREDSIVKSSDQQIYYAAAYYFYSRGIGFIGCKITAANSTDTIKNYDTIEDWFIKRSD